MTAKKLDPRDPTIYDLKDNALIVFRSSAPHFPTQAFMIFGREHDQEAQSKVTRHLKAVGEFKNSMEAVIVAAGSISADLEKVLHSLGVKNIKLVTRPSSAKVVVHMDNGRVRVEKETESTCRVLIVDDSKTIRQILRRMMSADPSIEVVGEAERPSEVIPLIKSLKPNVITLDIGLPEMNGVELLRLYLKDYQIPTVMISALSREESPLVLESLEAGAVDYVQKPSFDEIASLGPVIIEKLKNANQAKVRHGKNRKSFTRLVGDMRQDMLLAIGASTGGTEAIKALLMQLPENIPPTVIVQHIPAVFSAAFANRLNELCPFEVREAKNGDVLQPNLVLVAPGGLQMRVKRNGKARGDVIVEDAPPMNRHKPSVDFLFHSVASEFRGEAFGVILTGMGADGAEGMLDMKNQGAFTVAQDEASCVVYGMPKAAFKLGGVEKVLSLDEMAPFIKDKLRKS